MPNSLNDQLFDAVKNNKLEEVILCLKKGADVKVQDEKGITPLHWASLNGHTELAKLLIEKGADIKAQDKNGITPLHRASENGNTELAKILIDNMLSNNRNNSKMEKPWFLSKHKELSVHWDYTKSKIATIKKT